MSENKTLYDVLDLAPQADDAAVRKAYRKAAKAHHPDRNPGDAEAAAVFREVADAFAVLSDPVRRAKYDRTDDAGTGPDMRQAQASRLLFACMVNVVVDFSQAGKDVKELDLVEAMRFALKRQAAEVKSERETALAAAEVWKDVAARFDGSVGKALLANLALDRAGDAEAAAQGAEGDLEVIEACQALLKEATYRADKKAKATGNGYGTTYAQVAWSSGGAP